MRFRLLSSFAALSVLAFVIAFDPAVNGQGARGKSALLNPAEATEQAPPVFRVNFDTSKGSFVVEVHRDWAPLGADRFYNLAKRGYYDGNRFFRVITGNLAMAQFGINGDPEISKAWSRRFIVDDPPRTLGAQTDTPNPKGGAAQSNRKGFMAFTQSGTNRRATQVMIHLADNSTLDSQITPFGQVVSGLDVVEKLYSGYGEAAPTGKGPMPTPIYEQGNAYLEKEFPQLDYVKTATLVQ